MVAAMMSIYLLAIFSQMAAEIKATGRGLVTRNAVMLLIPVLYALFLELAHSGAVDIGNG
jgi:hypothetical protein